MKYLSMEKSTQFMEGSQEKDIPPPIGRNMSGK